MWCKLTTNVDLTIKNEYQIQLQFDTHLGLHFHFLYSKTELLNIKEGSLIFANCGVSLGFARIITFDGCIHDGWLAFQDISEGVNKVFLLKLLNHFTDFFRKTAPDGTQPNLNTTIMKNFEVIIPPLDLQEKFVKIIIDIELKRDLFQKGLNEIEIINQSLMQRAFKGELLTEEKVSNL